MNRIFTWAICAIAWQSVLAQQFGSLEGQASGLVNYGWEDDMPLFGSLRYIPTFSYGHAIDSNLRMDVELAANAHVAGYLRPFDSTRGLHSIDPYRAWVRLDHSRWNFRLGLQKIDFGSATLIRPLQWFNQLDPRDPLQLTNGVYAALYRAYFNNNANLWVWGLYGNEDPRGLNPYRMRSDVPEFGGRIQYPVPMGELAVSVHRQVLEGIQEEHTAMGLDGKWDVGIGLWFEAQWPLTTESVVARMASLGADYTFEWGNGLYVLLEGLATSRDGAEDVDWVASAVMLMYPLGLFDQLQAIYYSIPGGANDQVIAMLNWQHQFIRYTMNLSAYYQPELDASLVQNELFQPFSGPGIRITFVYNH